ncbi:MAG: amino acid adenylation domain-containing protein [Gemmatimonadota bacterium]
MAVVGMAGRFPGASDVEEFWRNLRSGASSLRRLTEEELAAAGVSPREFRSPGYVPVTGALEGAELFDAGFFGLTPREALVMNPQQRVFLECAWEALERAGYAARGQGGRMGVYASEGENRYMLDVLSQRELARAVGTMQVLLSNSPSVATLTSYKLGLQGPSLNVQTACSSSLVAVHLACRSLLSGDTDVALAGGVRIDVPLHRGYRYREGGILSPTGECTPFDAAARGAVGGSGAGVVVLKRLEDALADGDHVHAVIRGSAVNNDGDDKVGFTAPRWEGQAAVIREALAAAGVDPADVSYVEAHGSGTEVGDPIEAAALTAAFGQGRPGSCALGAVKSSVGHLDAAAGIVGLIKAALALENGEIPPSPYFREPNPRIDFARSPFYVNPELRPWARGGTPRRAGVSSFGMGGTNAHVVLEEAPQARPSGPSRPWQLLVLSARTPAALDAATARLAEHLRAHPGQKLADVAHTLRVGRRRFAHRRALVCRGRDDAAAALAALDARRLLEGTQERDARPVAFLFPGVGDHYAQMARGLYEAEPVFRREVDRCAEILADHTGTDVLEALFPGDPSPEQTPGGAAADPGEDSIDLRGMLGRGAERGDDPLARTDAAHPAVFVVEYALARLWMSWGVRPAAMIGHSLGEYVAATVAGVFTLEDALALLAHRARLISALPAGAMLAVPLDPAELRPRLRGGLALAAHNAPGLCTVSGPVDAVDALEAELAAAGLACRRLNAEHAFHSAEMEPVAGGLAERLRAMPLAAPGLPFVSNVTGTWIRAEEATDPEYWARHLCGTVRFAEGLEELLRDGSRVLLEVGPGRTLGTFALHAGAAESAVFASLRHAFTRRADQVHLLETLGRLWVAGVRVDWDGFAAGERRRRVLLPTYPFERQAYWVERRRRPRRRRPGAPARGREAAGERGGSTAGVGIADVAAPDPGAAAARGLQPRPDTGTRYVAPQGELQVRMARLWEDLLGFEGIGAHDEFFSLGGHSLMATQLVARVQQEFGAAVSLNAVFDDPTVAGMAGKVAALRTDAHAERAAAIPRAPRDRPLPLSYHQERVWVLDRLEPGSPMYNVPVGTWLRGPVDVDAARRALAEIVRRHDVYRTVYMDTDAGPVQVVRPDVEIPLPVDDLTGVPEAERLATVRRRLTEEARRPIDLVNGPVLRVRLLRLDAELHALLMVVHHVIMDGWSGGIFVYEWTTLYEAFRAGRPSPLPELPIQYADYAVWQREQLSGERLEQHLAFWRESMRGVPPVLELPVDRPHPPVQSFRGGLYGAALGPELVERLRALAQRRHTTFHVVLAAAFQALCFRYTGQEDFAMGSVAANRHRPEVQGLIGFFINTIPVRARPSARLPFEELVERARSFMAEAYAHAEVPFQMILDAVRPERDPSRNALIQVMLGIQAPGDHGPPPEEDPGVSMHMLEDSVIPLGDSGTSKFDLTILVEEGAEPSAMVEYNSDIFDRATAVRFLDHYLALLDAVADAPGTPLEEISLLLPDERRQLLAGPPPPPAPLPDGERMSRAELEALADWVAEALRRARPAGEGGEGWVPVHERVLARAAETPDAVAAVGGGGRLTYGELARRSAELAAHLRGLGAGPETRVGLLAGRSPELVVAMLATLRAGAAYLPIDPGTPAERVRVILADAAALVVLADAALADRLGGFGGTVVTLGTPLPPAPSPARGEEEHDVAADGDALSHSRTFALSHSSSAYVVYTSGSTGTPKGVVATHGGLANLVDWHLGEFAVTAADRATQLAGLGFDAAVWETWPYLAAGATLHLVADEETRASPEALRDLLLDRGITLAFVPTPLAEGMLGLEWPRDAALRALLTGGDALRSRPAADAPFALVNAYGPTENTVVATSGVVPPDGGGRAPAIGRPIRGVRAYVLDRGLNPAPTGVPGALYLAGDGVARGYLGRPAATAEAFVPCPFGEAGERMYATGDRVRRLPSGELEFLGRTDHQVKLRGFRIEPGEIESVLLRDPRVRECLVAARAGAAGEQRLVAYLAGAGLPGPEELRARLRESLPDYMVPSAFVALERLPLTPNGKVDRGALPDPGAHGASGRGHAPPRTPVERALAEVWSEVLGVERVGIDEHFFELGGDSILAIQVSTAARRAGLRVLPRQLFEHTTIAELARAAGTGAAAAAEQGTVTGAAPLTPIQRWFFAQEPPAPHHYNQGLLLVPPRPLDARLLERALASLLEHHDALRLRFRRGSDGWTQEHAPAGERAPLASVDLARLDGAARGRAMEAAADRVQAGLDLERGPVLRAACFRTGDGAGRLLLALHHLVVDGVSWRILLEDLETAYVQLERGEPVRLPAKTTSWRAWAERLAAHAGEPGTAAEAAYWVEQARSAAAPLPLDDPRAEDTAGLARTVAVQLEADETEALLREVPAAYRTHVDEVLVCALARALSRWTGERRVRLDLEGHGREEGRFEGVDLSRTVGWFTSLYPVLVELPAAGGPGEALGAVREQLRAVPGRGLGYGLLRWTGGAAAELEPAPPAEVAFNYLGQVDRTVSEDTFFRLAPESMGAEQDPRRVRPHRLEVNGIVSGGRLGISFGYGAAALREGTVQRLAGWYLEELRALIAHCRVAGAGGYGPGDFPLAGLDREALHALLGSDRGVEDVYPLTPMQEGMLFHSLLAPGSGVYVGQFGLVLEGPLDVAALRAAWQGVLARHDALRAGFAWARLARPVQVVRREAELPFRVEDWRGLDGAGQEERMERWLEADRAAGFDPGGAPLMRLALFRVGDEEHRLVWTQHHLIMDGWSLSLVFGDVLAGYAARVRGEAPRAAPGPRFREYVAWLERQDRSRAARFWKAALAGFDTPTPLPAARAPRGGGRGHAGAALLLPPERTGALHERARRLGVTPSTLLQGAWALLLSRYSGEDDVLFGATVSGRPAELPGAEETVGLFINTLPVRVRLEAEATLGEWLAGLQKEQAGAREYEYAPLVEVAKWSEVPAGRALFESLVVFENFPVDRALAERAGELRGVRVRSGVTREQPSYPLWVQVIPGERLRVEIVHDRDRLEEGAAGRLAGHLDVLLETLAGDPARRLREVSLLRGAERAQVLEAWNATAAGGPRERCLHELFAGQAARTPDAAALGWGGERVTYAQLDRRSARLAGALRRRGVGPEVRVGVCMQRTPEVVVALLAVLRAGGAYVPMDPAYPAERLRHVLADSGAALLLADPAAAERLGGCGVEAVLVDPGAEADDGADAGSAAAAAGCPLFPVPCSLSLAYVVYTSGSTGTPKGVLGTHRGIVNRLAWMWGAYPFAAGEVCCQKTSLAFVDSVWEVFGPLLAGVPSVLVPDEDARDPEALAALLSRHGVTRVVLVPSLLRALLDAHPDLGERCPRLRLVVSSGEELPPGLARRFAEAVPGATLLNLYGSSEVAADSTHHALAAGAAGEGRVPIGRPIRNTRVYVADAAMQPLPPGAAGELYVAGDGVARGYMGNPAATAERFVPDPFASAPGGRMYRTGDRARWTPGGELEYLGRADRQVKVRGFRIEPREVEAALAAHPEVREAAVAVREDAPGDRRLVGYVVPAAGSGAAPAELRAHLAARLPEYMVPSAFVVLDRMPLNANGKVDRRALPAPEPGSGAGAGYVAPATAAEEVLAGIWAEVLGTETVGARDSFFELGGHSLLATQVVSRARQAFGVEVPLRALFEAPTVAALAARVEELRGAGTSPAPPIERVPREAREEVPLSFAQQRLWLVDRIEPGSPAYNMPFALRLRGALDAGALRASLDELVRRHETLRTTLEERGGVPVQVVHPPAPAAAASLDLRGLADGEREREAERLAREEALAPFDLERGPLLRSTLLRLAEDDHVLLFTLHHVVGDGWSMDVLVREVSALYAAFGRGAEPDLPELPIQYADFAVWQRAWLSGPVLEAQVGWWRERLRGAPPLLELPVDRPRAPGRGARAGSHRFALPAEAARGLRALSRREGTTLFMTLLAGWQALLGRYAGQRDVVVGTPIAGRTRTELEGLIGFFVNMLPLRADLGGDPAWTELLARVRDTALGAYSHQDLPFERLVDELGVERSLLHAPVFQVVFALSGAGAREARLSLGTVGLEPFGGGAEVTKFDLNLSILDGDDGLDATLAYRAGLYDAETVARMASHLEILLEAMAAAPGTRLSEVSLLRGAERAHLLHAWNGADTGYRGDLCIHELVHAQVLRTPQAPALRFGEQSLGYAELFRRSCRLAHLLRRRGVGPETLVAICMEPAPEAVVSVLGVLLAGGAWLPLDPALPPERRAYVLADAAPLLLLTQAALAGRLEGCGVPLLPVDAEAETTERESGEPPATGVSPDNLAYVVYTSGSTGRPKGVLADHRGVGNTFLELARVYGSGPGVRSLAYAPLHFDAAVADIFTALCSGAELVLAPSEDKLPGEELARLLREQAVTHLKVMPSALAVTPAEDLPALKVVVTGGEVLPVEQVRRWGAGRTFFNGYGTTEAGIRITSSAYTADAGDPPIGRPVANTQLHVLDARLEPVPPGVAGELYIGGVGMARGYLGRPDLTAAAFLPDPHRGVPGARLYRTGDVGRRRADGEIEFLGRTDHQVKVRGYRVELGEIEATLRRHAQVGESAVLLREDVPGRQRLVAYVTGREGAEPGAAELREHAREQLPEYMVPWAVVVLERMPVTANGKIDRRALPAPERAEADAYVAPRTPAEELLAGIWAEVLGVERVGATENFFELGGHSLLATQVVSRLRAALGVEVPLRTLFEAPTVAALAGRVEELRAAAPPPVPGVVAMDRSAWRRARERTRT